MTERLFGTDGVRGLANDVITPALAMELAQAASIVLGFDTVEEGIRPRAVIANDSRSSADFIVSAMKAGFASAGVDVLDAGIVPTPAAAYLVAHTGADFGVTRQRTTVLSSWPEAARSWKTPLRTPLSAFTVRSPSATRPVVLWVPSSPWRTVPRLT